MMILSNYNSSYQQKPLSQGDQFIFSKSKTPISAYTSLVVQDAAPQLLALTYTDSEKLVSMVLPTLTSSPDIHSHLCLVNRGAQPYNILHMLHMKLDDDENDENEGEGDNRYLATVLGCVQSSVMDTTKVYTENDDYYKHEQYCK